MNESRLASLQYKDFAGFPSLNGFYSKTLGSHLLIALYEHFAMKGLNANSIIDVDSELFKCTFTLTENMEQLQPDEASDEDEPQPSEIETRVTA